MKSLYLNESGILLKEELAPQMSEPEFLDLLRTSAKKFGKDEYTKQIISEAKIALKLSKGLLSEGKNVYFFCVLSKKKLNITKKTKLNDFIVFLLYQAQPKVRKKSGSIEEEIHYQLISTI